MLFDMATEGALIEKEDCETFAVFRVWNSRFSNVKWNFDIRKVGKIAYPVLYEYLQADKRDELKSETNFFKLAKKMFLKCSKTEK